MKWLVLKKNSAIFVILHFIMVYPLFAASQINYDTAWTLVYDGGKTASGLTIDDKLLDVQSFPDGGCIVVGLTRDSASYGSILLMKISPNGEIMWKRLYSRTEGGAIVIARDGDFIIGGHRGNAPFVQRTDSLGNVKWST